MGKILRVSSNEDEDGPYHITFLRRLADTKKKFFEPTIKDEDFVSQDMILKKLSSQKKLALAVDLSGSFKMISFPLLLLLINKLLS